jgi:acyl-CoA synthetase (AMP-forming)/AMP-acid ligase II
MEMNMPALAAPDTLALQRLYHWERTAPDRVVFTQPVGAGVVRDYTWREVMDQSRRMAAHLQSMGVQHGDRVALLSKNTAHWMMSDFSIWLAGAVSVPLYPTLSAGNAGAMMNLRDVAMFDGAALTDGYAGLISQIGIRTQSADYASKVSASIATNVERDRAGVSGVNLDEEAASLLQYQQAYQASAKMIQIAQNIFDTLIQNLGR